MTPLRSKAKAFYPIAVLLFAFLFSACGDALTGSLNEPEPSHDALVTSAAKGGDDIIPNQYIVVFKEELTDVRGTAQNLASLHGGELYFTYETALKGFAARFSEQAAVALRNNPNVAYIELDQVVTAAGSQSNPTWGLDRVDQRNLPMDATYSYDVTGAGVTAYIIDTGIRPTHADFGGRASIGYDALGGDGADCHGHGTHVAGTVGGAIWGVAKGVALVGVRVLNCSGSGSTSGVIAGIDWVTAQHQSAGGPSVANMSLGGGASSSLDNAVRNSIAAGVTYAVSAGNSNADACNYSPARTAEALTTGSTMSNDGRSSFSNYGSCVDIFAPGSGVKSAWYTSDTATATLSGTSMASPHVAGVAALYLEADPTATPAEVASAVTDNATAGVISGAGSGSPNLLLYALFGSSPPPPPPPNNPPTADFSYSATNLTVDFTDASSDSDGSVVSWSWDFGDGNGSTAQNPTHTYAAGGAYTVTLTATDDDGATDSASQSLTVSEPPPANNPPTAAFSYSATDLTVDFTDASSDSDGSVVSWSWDFGDGNGSTAQNPTHTYAAGGAYTVTLTATDDDGATDSASQNVTVSENAPPPNISLTASKSTKKGPKRVDLAWDGATSANVDVYRNGSLITTTPNTGAYRDTLGKGKKAKGTFTYQVCQEGTSTCSNESSVTY